MDEKYHDNWSFHLARLRRGLVRTAIEPVAQWTPLRSPQAGYSLVIGCPAAMVRVLFANLTLVRQQRRPNLREIIIGFDVTEHRADHALLNALRERFEDLPLRFVFYSPMQARVLDRIGWAWCYCWLNWVLPIAAVQTRYAFVHDLDALLLQDGVFEQRYDLIRERGDQYLGVNYYHGNGLTVDDQLAVTFEMIFDAADLRQRSQPIDLFNCVTRHDGRRVEFDTFLYPQRDRRRSLLAMTGQEMVHPTQLVCQYVELHRRRRYLPPERNNLPMLAYFHYLAGDEAALAQQAAALEQATGSVVALLGREADCRALSARHARWLATQIERVEQAVAGRVREPVQRYLASLHAFVGRQGAAALRAGEKEMACEPTRN
ncbi:MAG: hypothetical protein WD534_08420 [Phycisphaeraceae bacterium]